MNGGQWFRGASAAACMFLTSSAFGQASFGPLQPFIGAPSPVYVSAPYAGPEMGIAAPMPGVIGVAPPQIQYPAAPPQIQYPVAPPQVQYPAATVAPSLVVNPAPAMVPYQPINLPQSGCGSAPRFRLPFFSHGGHHAGYAPPTTTYLPPSQPTSGCCGGR